MTVLQIKESKYCDIVLEGISNTSQIQSHKVFRLAPSEQKVAGWSRQVTLFQLRWDKKPKRIDAAIAQDKRQITE